jgi:hypothetical protein
MKFYSLAALGVAVAAAALPAGCNQIQQQIVSAQQIMASDLPTACALVAQADAAFQTIAATGTIPAKDQKIEAQAYAGVSAICANPASVANPATALQSIANAYAAVVKARLGQ